MFNCEFQFYVVVHESVSGWVGCNGTSAHFRSYSAELNPKSRQRVPYSKGELTPYKSRVSDCVYFDTGEGEGGGVWLSRINILVVQKAADAFL